MSNTENKTVNFNLLYPEGTERPEWKAHPFLDEIGLTDTLGSDAETYYTTDPETIKYRQELFADILEDSRLIPLFDELNERLREYSDFSRMTDTQSNEKAFFSLVNLRFYVQIMDSLYSVICRSGAKYQSRAMIAFAASVKEECESEEYTALRKNLEELNADLLDIKSVTFGVNLNSMLQPKEAGIIAVNTEPYKSGDLIDRLLRLDFKKDDFTCLAPLTTLNSSKFSRLEMEKLNESVLNALGAILSDSLKKSSVSSVAYLSHKMSSFVEQRHDLAFIIRASRWLFTLREAGVPLCYPQIRNETHVKGLYPAFFAGIKDNADIVSNSLSFDERGMIYILTGPNSGGKTVFIRSVGMAQGMFQLGLPVCAKSALLEILDDVYTQFPSDATSGKSTGRLEEECRRLADLFTVLTPKSLVLMDEVFSSTSAKDGAELAESALDRFASIGCRCVFSTHIHELAAVYRDRADSDSDPIDLLAAEVLEDGTRTYHIIRGRAEGSSDAKTIAEKYGLI